MPSSNKPDHRRVVIDAKTKKYAAYDGRKHLLDFTAEELMTARWVEVLRTHPEQFFDDHEDSSNA